MNIAFKNSFLKIIKKTKDDKLKSAVIEVIQDCQNAENFLDINNLKKLKGYKSFYRIRIGDYRIGIKWEEEANVLYFVTLLHRKDIYKRFP